MKVEQGMYESEVLAEYEKTMNEITCRENSKVRISLFGVFVGDFPHFPSRLHVSSSIMSGTSPA